MGFGPTPPAMVVSAFLVRSSLTMSSLEWAAATCKAVLSSCTQTNEERVEKGSLYVTVLGKMNDHDFGSMGVPAIQDLAVV